MKIKNFFKMLNTFYNEGVYGTNNRILCKFYAQEGTFSFELHDDNKATFSKDSLLFESEVYYSWNGYQAMDKIIADIIVKSNTIYQILEEE